MFENTNEESKKTLSRSPKELSDLEENIDEIIKSLGGPMPYPDFNNEFKNQNEKNNPEKEGEMETDKENEKEETKQNQSEDGWNKILLQVNDLHIRWNGYIPKAIEAQAESKFIQDFRDNLNDLSEMVIINDHKGSLMVSNALYAKLSDFFDLYENEKLTETKKIRFLLRNIIIKAQFNEWNDLNEDLANLDTTWSLLRTKLDDEKHKEKKDVKNSLSYTLDEFREIIPRQNITLTKMKGSVILSDLEQIETS
jgi:hypothetical protein